MKQKEKGNVQASFSFYNRYKQRVEKNLNDINSLPFYIDYVCESPVL